jgi:outer membrane protein assembly factor BamB
VASGNNSSGPFGIYRTGDSSYTPLGRTDWFVVDVGIAPDGNQQAIVTSSGAYIDYKKTVLPQVGEYFGPTPIGAAYAPTGHKVYFPICKTNTVVQYDTRTMTPTRTFTAPGQFDWVGNLVFVEGRTRLSSDGSLLFVTLDSGVFYTSTKGPQ